MEIELSEDLQHYKESFILGLTVKQTFFSILALGVGTAIVLLLYTKIGVTLSCYVATPFVVPLALTGFYNYHGLTFWQFAGKMIHFAFFNRPLFYWSTESVEELKQMFFEEKQEMQKAGKRKAGIETERNRKRSRQKNTGIKKGKKEKKKIQMGEERLNTKRKGKRLENAEYGSNKKRKRRREAGMVSVTRKRKGAGMASATKKRILWDPR